MWGDSMNPGMASTSQQAATLQTFVRSNGPCQQQNTAMWKIRRWPGIGLPGVRLNGKLLGAQDAKEEPQGHTNLAYARLVCFWRLCGLAFPG